MGRPRKIVDRRMQEKELTYRFLAKACATHNHTHAVHFGFNVGNKPAVNQAECARARDLVSRELIVFVTEFGIDNKKYALFRLTDKGKRRVEMIDAHMLGDEPNPDEVTALFGPDPTAPTASAKDA